jgi:hypothetical protein
MVANESTQCSHAPPKQSTAHEKMTTSQQQRNCQLRAPVLLLLLVAVHVRFGLVTLDDRQSLKKAGMVANESTRCSHAPPKQSTAHDKNGHQLNSVTIGSRVLLCSCSCSLLSTSTLVWLLWNTVIVLRKLASTMVANESTQRSHAPPKQSTAHDKNGYQLNSVTIGSRVLLCSCSCSLPAA